MVYLDTTEDLNWLKEVHGLSAALTYRCAILYGTEDCPSKVELYARDDQKRKPTVFVWSEEDNRLILESWGQKPDPKFLIGRPYNTSDR